MHEGIAVGAIPAEAIHLRISLGIDAAGEFDDEADGVCGALRAVGDPLGQQEHFALFDHLVVWLAAIEWAQADGDIAFDLIEEFFGGIDVVVVAGVGATGDKDDGVFGVSEQLLVADRWLEVVLIVFDPLGEVKGG